MLKKLKRIGITVIILVVVIGIISAYFLSKNWMYRYSDELDQFFGEANWEYIGKESNQSTAFKTYSHATKNSPSREFPGRYNNWFIRFNHPYVEGDEWYISDHILKINKDKHGFFSSKKLSTKQALYLELMDIALYVASNEIFHEFIRSELTETEANTIDIAMYASGRPKPKLYSDLAKEPWFNVHDVTAEDFLTFPSQEFTIVIRARDYRLVDLTAQEKQNVNEALDRVEARLLETYGEHASFEIFFDDDMKADYSNGEKQIR